MRRRREPNWIQKAMEREIESRGEYIRSRFYVVEYQPSYSYREGDGHGGSVISWSKVSCVRVSDFYDNFEDAEAFTKLYEPDEGKSFRILQQKLYRRQVEEWF